MHVRTISWLVIPYDSPISTIHQHAASARRSLRWTDAARLMAKSKAVQLFSEVGRLGVHETQLTGWESLSLITGFDHWFMNKTV